MKTKLFFALCGLFLVGIIFISLNPVFAAKNVQEDLDDFAEFDDDFEEDEFVHRSTGSINKNTESAKSEPDVEVHTAESYKGSSNVEEHFDDDEVFVEEEDEDDDGFEDDLGDERPEKLGGGGRPQKLTITPVPLPLRGWQAYWSELLMLAGILVYMANYIMGRYKNQRLAQSFFDAHLGLLEENFALVGDSGKGGADDNTLALQGSNYQKISDSVFQIWCSGRACCEGMLVELKLLKRQDLISILSTIVRPDPPPDTLRITVELAKDEMEPMVFALATKKTAAKIAREMNDLSNYCGDRKPGEKYGLPSSFAVMTELGEVASLFLDSRTVAVINKFQSWIHSIHLSDQFTGVKTQEPELDKDGIMKMVEARRILIFSLHLPTSMSGNNADSVFEELRPIFQFIFYTIDRIRRLRLSKEGKAKAEKNRVKIEELFIKQTHAARAEAAAARREEKRRLEKERILQEEDPEKQRRWEEREQKREKKRKTPKVKQLKVKAL